MTLRFEWLAGDPLVGSGVDDSDAAIVSAKTDEDLLRSRIVAQRIGIFSEVDALTQLITCAVVDADFAISGVGNEKLVKVRHVNDSLRFG